MAYKKQLESLSEFKQEEFDNISRIMSEPFVHNVEVKNLSGKKNKRELLELYVLFFTKYLGMKFVDSKEKKLSIIRIIDKLKMQLELLELKDGLTNITNIKSAAKTLGRKSQSAFKIKETLSQ